MALSISFGSTGVHSLPSELLGKVFHSLYIDPEIPRTNELDSSHRLLQVMLVCQQFNRIVQSSPNLWTDLWLVRPRRDDTEDRELEWAEWIKKQIANSGQLPLQISIVVSHIPMALIYPFFLPTSSRWERLVITRMRRIIYPQAHHNPSTFRPLFRTPIPRLLALSVGALGVAQTTWGSVFCHAPSLVELECHEQAILFRPNDEEEGAQYEKIMRENEKGVHYDFAQNTLEVLSISGVIIPISIEPRVMRRLRLLSLASPHSRPWEFLGRWDLPVLEELRISGDPYAKVHDGVPPFVLPNLRSIHWTDLKYYSPHGQSADLLLLRILSAAPKLRSFAAPGPSTRQTLYLQPAQMSPFLETCSATGAPKYSPDLRELRLPEASMQEVEQLVDIRPHLAKVKLGVLRKGCSPVGMGGDWPQLEMVKGRVELWFRFTRDNSYDGIKIRTTSKLFS